MSQDTKEKISLTTIYLKQDVLRQRRICRLLSTLQVYWLMDLLFLTRGPRHYKDTSRHKRFNGSHIQDMGRWPLIYILKIPTIQGHPLQSTTVGMQKLGTKKVSSRFSRSFPTERDKEDIENKDVSGIWTPHHKNFNKGKVIQKSNDQEPDCPPTANLPWQDFPSRRFPHPNSPTNGLVWPSP